MNRIEAFKSHSVKDGLIGASVLENCFLEEPKNIIELDNDHSLIVHVANIFNKLEEEVRIFLKHLHFNHLSPQDT
jgi:hypothetical protein